MQDLSANILGEEKDAVAFVYIPLQHNKFIQQKQSKSKSNTGCVSNFLFTLYLIILLGYVNDICIQLLGQMV